MNGVLTFSQWAKSTRLDENVKAAKSFLIKRYADSFDIKEITPEVEHKALENREYTRIRELLKGNDGYVYAFVRFHFLHGAGLGDLSNLYQKIKDNSGSLNSLPMTIEEYSKQDSVNGVNPFEALLDQFHNIEQRRKHKWIIEKVNGDLRRSIKQLSQEDMDRLYTAAKIIDKADDDAGDFKDPVTGATTNNRLALLKKSNAFKDAAKYLDWVEELAEGVSNSDVASKVKALRQMEPEAGILYNRGGYLAMSIRTERAQKELCSVANWCLNRGSWGNYGGKAGYLQINIFNFNLPVTHPLHITGTTLDEAGLVKNSHDKNDIDIIKSRDLNKHLTVLDYPNDLIEAVVKSIPAEKMIEEILTQMKVNTLDSKDLLISLIKATYVIDLDSDAAMRDTIITIVRDQLKETLSREIIIDLFIKNGVLSTFVARLLNLLIPDLTDSEKTQLLNKTDIVMNDPTRGLKTIITKVGRSMYPGLTKAIDQENEIKEIIANGDSID